MAASASLIKDNLHIQIVRAGRPGLSSLSLASCAAILAVLRQHYAVVGVTTVHNEADLELLVSKQPDLVFMGMKYLPTPDGTIWLSSYLDQHETAHTGSAQVAIEFELNKPMAKQRVLDAGLASANFEVVKHGQMFTGASLPFPLFVKPASLGGGEGVDEASLVHNLAQLKTKVKTLQSKHSSDILIEEYLPGREFSVAILKEESGEHLVMPIELVAPGSGILSQATKSLNQEAVLAVDEPLLRASVTDLALSAFMALGARDYGRIDIRLDGQGQPHFLEANLIPSLISGYGNFPKACVLNYQIGYEAMLLRIVELGLARVIEEEAPTLLGDPILSYGGVY